MRLLAPRPRLLRALRGARVTLAAAAAAATTALAGCGSDDGTSPEDVAGRYTLVAFAGNAIPFVVTGGGVRSELLGGEFNVRADRTFDISLQSRDTELATGEVEETEEAYSGRYTQRGNVLTFSNTTDTDDDGVGDLDRATATVSAGTVVIGQFTFRQ